MPPNRRWSGYFYEKKLALPGRRILGSAVLMHHFSDVRYTSSSVRPSVTFVHPTQAIEIFGNISTSFGTLAIG